MCHAQEGNEKLMPLLKQLESEIAKGNLLALRDLGTLLDKKSTSKEAQNILKTYTFFLENELIKKGANAPHEQQRRRF